MWFAYEPKAWETELCVTREYLAAQGRWSPQLLPVGDSDPRQCRL